MCLLTAYELHELKKNKTLIILDASIPKVTESLNKSDPKKVIPNARFFNLKTNFSNTDSVFPNMCPTAIQFENQARKLGIKTESTIVIYDNHGVYSSARAWWMFKAFGHNNVAVLNGGLSAWEQLNYPLSDSHDTTFPVGNFKAKARSGFFIDFKTINQLIPKHNHLIIDARSSERFKGKIKEPRDGLRRGNIPSSKNLPYTEVLDQVFLKNTIKLKTLFNNFKIENKNVVLYCGSGVTACVLALAITSAGIAKPVVYDGSWTEYGTLIK